jgi:tetratricopeptide (TPR) repeat protein
MFTTIKHLMREHVFSRLSISGDSFMYGLLAFLVIIGPIFFIPARAFSVISSKGFLIFFVATLGLLAYGVHVLRKGVLVFPRQKIFFILLLLVFATALGSFLSPGFSNAFLGYGFETTSWLFTAIFALMVFLSYFVFNSYDRIGTIYGGLMVMFIVLAIFHILRFFVGPGFATLGVLGGNTATLMGSWGDLGIFFGLILILCVITLELAGLKKGFKWFVAILALLAVIMLLVMNIAIVWVVLGLVSLILALYLFSFAYWDTEAHSYKKSERVPWFVLCLFIISMVAIFFGGFFNNLASRYQALTWNDIRPSWKMTLSVTGKSLAHNFATGYGPNSFGGVWSLSKPVALSGADISRTDFSQGVGFVPTQLSVNGVLGALLWVLLFIGIIGLLIRKTRAGFAHSWDRYFAIGLGMSILYLGILAWVYVPGGYLLILLAILIGAFIALFDTNEKSEKVFSFIKDPRASFFGILGITALIVATFFLGYIGLRKTISFVHYTKGMVLLNQGKFTDANNQINIAAAYANHDIYHHQLASFALSDVGQIVSSAGTNKQAASQQVEQTLGIALAHAQAATKTNSLDYRNWVLLGDVYRSMVNLGVADAYDRATSAYQEAQKRNPNDSTMLLYFAQLAVAKKDVDSALNFIKDSITKYPTSDAYIVRAQIQLSQQKFDSASDSLKAALALDPYNADLAYQYGLLLLSQRHYTDAIPMLQQAILVNRNYAIAYVYLGYAYERAGDMTNANKVYDYIKQTFKGGAEAITAVKNGQIDQPDPTTTPDATKDTSKLPDKKTVAPAKKK